MWIIKDTTCKEYHVCRMKKMKQVGEVSNGVGKRWHKEDIGKRGIDQNKKNPIGNKQRKMKSNFIFLKDLII